MFSSFKSGYTNGIWLIYHLSLLEYRLISHHPGFFPFLFHIFCSLKNYIIWWSHGCDFLPYLPLSPLFLERGGQRPIRADWFGGLDSFRAGAARHMKLGHPTQSWENWAMAAGVVRSLPQWSPPYLPGGFSHWGSCPSSAFHWGYKILSSSIISTSLLSWNSLFLQIFSFLEKVTN